MNTSTLQDITKATHQAAANEKLQSKNDEKAKVKQAIMDSLHKITLDDLKKTAQKGDEEHVVYASAKYKPGNEMCGYMSTLVYQMNKDMLLPAKLEQSNTRVTDSYSLGDMVWSEWVDTCAVKYTWKKPDKKPANWW